MTAETSEPARSIWTKIWDRPGRIALIGLAGYVVVPLLMTLVDDFLRANDTGGMGTFVLGQVLYPILWLTLVLMIALFVGGTTLWLVRLIRRKRQT